MTWTRAGMALAAAAALGWTGRAGAESGSGQGSQQMQGGQAQGSQLPGLRQQLKQGVDAHADAAKQQIDDLRVVQLTVRNVDPANNKVTFDAKVSPGASFQAGQGNPIAIDQLTPGEQVRAAFDPATGNVVAVEVITPQRSSNAGASSGSMSGASPGGAATGRATSSGNQDTGTGSQSGQSGPTQ